MPVLRTTALIDAPLPTVGGALRDIPLAEHGLAELGVRARVVGKASALLVPGDELSFRMPVLGVPVSLRTRIVRADADALTSVLVAGPLRELRHEAVLAAVGDRTLITDSVHWKTPLGGPGRLADVALLRRKVLAVQAQRVRAVRELAESWAGRKVVVGAAIVRSGLLLAQQRRYPADHAGRWELPGGRVEPGEGEREAVVRECKEELDVEVRPTGRVGTDVPLSNGMILRIHSAELVEAAAVPKAVEHHDVRWVKAADLPALDWLDADRVLVHSLRELVDKS
ncbi:8-oxo-dGTP diphosphatase [Saccharopolyspora erythraea NRRL 2338]|uniref:8-oxo-dGTP diphosphatase n=1 Tax=Saccharopolyspora erythraea TaxID=1836 RepID=A0ABN1E7K9_SACER|nr:NUDIX domain-containing protein [Saccharopolyspora erythraea]PFG94126.1 8-oxo-dGTP diphosphatase [Saccharopolyspora erythraea NRRL 2338]